MRGRGSSPIKKISWQIYAYLGIVSKKAQWNFQKCGGRGGQRPFGLFSKKHLYLGRRSPLIYICVFIFVLISGMLSVHHEDGGRKVWSPRKKFPFSHWLSSFGLAENPFHHCWHFDFDLCPLFVLFLFGFYHNWLSSFGLRNFASLPSTSSAQCMFGWIVQIKPPHMFKKYVMFASPQCGLLFICLGKS